MSAPFVAAWLMTGAAAFGQAPAMTPAPQATIVAEPEQHIVVIGLPAPYQIAAGPLRKAQKAYVRGRTTAAPTSTLFLQISGARIAGLVLTL